MESAEHDELVMIRTQLTVALLAVTQLQRKHAVSADADRLLGYVATALAHINREVHKIDALMDRLEDRAAMHANPAHPHMPCSTGDDQGRQEHDERLHHHAETSAFSSTVR